MDHTISTCDTFNKPKDWVTCYSCCKYIGIDVKGLERTLESYSLLQICSNSLPLMTLNLEFDSFIDLPRWRKILKSKFLLNERPSSKRQIEALGLLDGIVGKFDCFFLWHCNRELENIDFTEYFKAYFRRAKLQFYIERCDKSVVIKNILKVIRRTQVFHTAPEEEHEFNDFHEYFCEVAAALLKAIFMYCSDDSDLVIECIDTLCFDDYCKDFFFEIFERFNLLEFIMYHANARKFEFWGLYKKMCPFFREPIEIFIAAKRYDLVKVMMKYGYQYGYKRNDGLYFIHKIPNRELRPNAIEIMREMKTKDIYPEFPILAIFRNKSRTKEDVDFIRHIGKDISTPYVTLERLLAFARRIIKRKYMKRYVRACSDYENSEVYKEPYNVYGPRSLLQLCRITIREQLRSNHQLPVGVKKLDVPAVLHKYLNLKE